MLTASVPVSQFWRRRWEFRSPVLSFLFRFAHKNLRTLDPGASVSRRLETSPLFSNPTRKATLCLLRRRWDSKLTASVHLCNLFSIRMLHKYCKAFRIPHASKAVCSLVPQSFSFAKTLTETVGFEPTGEFTPRLVSSEVL